jgi:hypothetical protein
MEEYEAEVVVCFTRHSTGQSVRTRHGRELWSLIWQAMVAAFCSGGKAGKRDAS